MSPATVDDSDEGKSVVNANGDEIGIVATVEAGTAHVNPDPGVTDKIKAKLGWEDADAKTYPLSGSDIATITDDEIRLQRS